MQQAKRETKAEEMLNGLGELEKVLSSLANEDALRIFAAAAEGIESSTEAIKRLNLTQKRYYVWLKRLIDAGLIEKRDNTYVQTMLGKLFHGACRTLSNALGQRDQLDLADKLAKSNTLSTKEKEEILNAISGKKLLGTATISDVIHEVRMITDYDSFVIEVIGMMDGAKESIHLAASKIDLRVTDAVVNAIGREVRVYALTSVEPGSETKELLRMLLNPASIKMIRMLFGSKQINVRLTTSLSFSFLIVDDEYGVIELPHPALHDFHVAFKFRNALFCRKLTSIFTSLYEKGMEDPRVETIRKYLSFHK